MKFIIVTLLCFAGLSAASDLKEQRIDITDFLDGPSDQLLECFYIQLIFDYVVPHELAFTGPFQISFELDNLIKLNFNISEISITGFDTQFTECKTMDPEDVQITSSSNFRIFFTDYLLDGSLVDHIPVTGDGEAEIIFDDLTVHTTGTATGGPYELYPQFTTFNEELILDRWWVFLNSFNPGTDMLTLFNEFFMQVGPEIFQIFTGYINSGGRNLILMELVNNLLENWYSPNVTPDEFLKSSSYKTQEAIEDFFKQLGQAILKDNPFKHLGVTLH